MLDALADLELEMELELVGLVSALQDATLLLLVLLFFVLLVPKESKPLSLHTCFDLRVESVAELSFSTSSAERILLRLKRDPRSSASLRSAFEGFWCFSFIIM